MTLRVHPDEIVERSTSPLLRIASWWERVPLGWVAEVVNGAAFRADLFNNNGRGMPLIRIRDVGKTDTAVHYDGDFERKHIVKSGDLLVGMDGDFRIARWTGPDALLNQRVCKLTVRDDRFFDDRLLEHCLQPYLDAIHHETSSVTVKHLSSLTVQDLPIPLPPRAEQSRIVALIEEHLSRLDAAGAAVRSGRARLSSLWEACLQEIFDASWPRSELGDLAAEGRPICYGILKPKTASPGVVPYVEVRSIVGNKIDADRLHLTTRELHEEFRRSELRPGDVVLAIRGSFDRAAVVPADLVGANVSRDVARISPGRDIDSLFLSTFLVSPEARRYFTKHARGVAVRGVNIGDLRRLPVPVPSRAMQSEAVHRIEGVASITERLRAELESAEQRATQLRRSVLAAAFAGQLVEEVSSDESAPALLERIQAARPANERKARAAS